MYKLDKVCTPQQNLCGFKGKYLTLHSAYICPSYCKCNLNQITFSDS